MLNNVVGIIVDETAVHCTVRDVQFLMTLPDEQTKAYGERLLNEIRNMFKVIHERDNMAQKDFTNALEKAKEIITAALQNVPSQLNKDGKEEKREAKNMANRLATPL